MKPNKIKRELRRKSYRITLERINGWPNNSFTRRIERLLKMLDYAIGYGANTKGIPNVVKGVVRHGD